MDDSRSTLERMYQGTIVEGGPSVVIFAFAALAAIIVGLVAPAGGLAIMALGVLGVMIVNFVDSGLGQDDGTSQTGSAARRKKTPAPETD